MKLMLAVSQDGFLCTGESDDMRWTGRSDKLLFKWLTMTGGPVIVGRKTAALLPALKHRQVHHISRSPALGITLEEAARQFPDAWCIGGPILAEEALKHGLIDRAFIVRSPVILGAGISVEPIMQLLPAVSVADVIGEHAMNIYLLS